MHFCGCPIHCRVPWRVGRQLGSCSLISVQPLIGSTIWAFSISSALWVMEVLSWLYWHSFYQTDHSTLWWVVVGVNRLILYQECRRAVLWDRYCSVQSVAVSCARFLTGGVFFGCDIAHRRSVAVLCMLYKIRCIPMHPLNGALPGPYVPVRFYTRCSGRTSVHLCGASLQNIAVQQDFYSPLGVPLERSC